MKKESFTETFTLKPASFFSYTFSVISMYSLENMGLVDEVETMGTNGFLLSNPIKEHLKTAKTTKALISKLAKEVEKQIDATDCTKQIEANLSGLFRTIKDCYKVANVDEIVLIISTESVQDMKQDCECGCVDPNTLN
jgi:hypothetical protein